MSIEIKKLTVGPLLENCYIVFESDNEKNTCFLVDPGAGGQRIINSLKSLKLTPQAIFLTHGHFDHIMAVDWVRREYPGVKVYAQKKEAEVINNPENSLLSNLARDYFIDDVNYLEDGEKITLADIPCEVIHTPGHTVGSSCLFLTGENIIFSGDTLFYESAGRTDFPTGSTMDLSLSINEVLMKLPEETSVYPGHGESTTIGHEKKYNFCVYMR